jgi:hypothetical protein
MHYSVVTFRMGCSTRILLYKLSVASGEYLVGPHEAIGVAAREHEPTAGDNQWSYKI